jgi:hypothetical protein
MGKTYVKGEPNQINSLSPPCELVERGRKAGMIIIERVM